MPSNILIGDSERQLMPGSAPEKPEKGFWESSASVITVLTFALTVLSLTLGLAFTQFKTNAGLLSDDATAQEKFKEYDQLKMERQAQNARMEAKLDGTTRRLDRIENKQDRIEDKQDKIFELLLQFKR